MEEYNSPFIFSDWLKKRRKSLDLTQEELAKRVGCSLSALRKIESGDRRPSKQLAGLLAKALDIAGEDQETFIRVARGDLSLERLPQPLHKPPAFFPDLRGIPHIQPGAQPVATPKPPSPIYRIPLQVTPLIGREDELAAMERLFTDPQCRLLTLTGMGGIGKTRLAIEFALRSQVDFPGGVFFIPLTSVNSSEKIVTAIAEVLDFGFSGPGDLKEQLFNYIASQTSQDVLLVFDNLEHLLSQASSDAGVSDVVELISEILQCLPNVKILGTSRERMDMHGEWTYELHGLSVPPPNFVGHIEEYDSIILFVKSAQRIQLDFQASAHEQQYLVQISQMVEGVPLAIELAAAWVGILSCQEIAREIKSSIDFLTTSMRNIPERHRSIRVTFDHSWKLLSAEERWALCQLAVFQGGFERNAAQQIAGASLSLLASLVAKSLVGRTENGRFDLHEVIRQYALSHLNDHPQKLEPHTRHCEYYLTMVRDCAHLLKTGVQQETIRRLTGEIDNIRAAWFWAIDHKDFDLLRQAGRGFGWYFEITGLYREGIEQLELLVQALVSEPQNDRWHKIMGLALLHQGLLNFRQGEFDFARKLYEESILALRPVGEQSLLVDSLCLLGTILHLQGEYEKARSSLEEGLFLARQIDDHWFEAWAIFNLGYIDSLLGQFSQGYEQMQVGVAMWRELGDPQSIALGLNFLIPTQNKLGLFDEAITSMHESIALCEQSKNRWGMGTAYRFLGLAYIAAGQPIKARTHLLKSLEIFGEFAIGWDIARSLSYLGDAAMMAGNLQEARKMYRDALQSSIETQAIPIALDVLTGLGDLQAQFGELENALLFCYYVLHHPFSENESKSRAETLRAVLEPKLNQTQITSVRVMATEKTFDMITKMALETA